MGFKWGKDCRYFHPILCKSSVGERECLKDACTYIHLKGTRRTKLLTDEVQKITTNSQERSVQSTPSAKNDLLEKIEQMIHSMKRDYEQEIRTIRSELTQMRGFGTQWMGTQNLPVQSPHFYQTPFHTNPPLTIQDQKSPQQMTAANNGSMPRSYY